MSDDTPPLGVLSEPQENRTPQSALRLLRNKGKWHGAGMGGETCSPKTRTEEKASVMPGTMRSQVGTFSSIGAFCPRILPDESDAHLAPNALGSAAGLTQQ